MEAFLVSLGVIALAELGDKTQFLSLYLAARYRKPLAVLAGIFVSTLLSSILSALAGHWIGRYLTPDVLRWTLGLSFVAMAAWVLLPERAGAGKSSEQTQHRGAFLGTAISFFIAELGDKTQLVTAALAARFDSLLEVIAGATIGMMLANLPALIGGHYFASRVPSRIANYVAAVIFLVQAVLTLAGIEGF
jgi:Ca2+/H+ antiporter, TMEM165/GDT1 family